MEKRIKEYNYCLDFIKGIACFFVVCMHCEFPGKAGMVVQCMTRFCVPFFFMVSGYYCFYENKNDAFILPNETYAFSEIAQNTVQLSANDYIVNQFLLIKSLENPSQTALGYFDGKEIRPLLYAKEHPYGVTPRNIGQTFFQEALMRSVEEAPLVICSGPAGTAKTFYSLAVGLHHILEKDDKEFRKILICRPSVKMDEDIGFLPGTEQDKIAPYLRPSIDNLEILIDKSKDKYENETSLKGKVDYLFQKDII